MFPRYRPRFFTVFLLIFIVIIIVIVFFCYAMQNHTSLVIQSSCLVYCRTSRKCQSCIFLSSGSMTTTSRSSLKKRWRSTSVIADSLRVQFTRSTPTWINIRWTVLPCVALIMEIMCCCNMETTDSRVPYTQGRIQTFCLERPWGAEGA